ncbi:MAG TPA: class I SAM-dependent methyltransferase [Gemmatimonadaceae bacterium]
MDAADAAELVGPAIEPDDSTWADIGAGTGTFTKVLAELLGPKGVVYAFDRDREAVRELWQLTQSDHERPASAQIMASVADLFALPDLPSLDGVLLANVLHFIPAHAQGRALTSLAERLAATGRMLVIEYDRRPPSRWVPHPVSRERLHALASESGLRAPEIVATKPSVYSGALYGAVLRR